MIVEDTPSHPDRSASDLMDALANARRRRVLRCLRSAGALTLDELARAIARQERADVEAGEAEYRIRIDLYHCQLPRLAAERLLRFDRDRALVAITERGRRTETWMREVDAADRGLDVS